MPKLTPAKTIAERLEKTHFLLEGESALGRVGYEISKATGRYVEITEHVKKLDKQNWTYVYKELRDAGYFVRITKYLDPFWGTQYQYYVYFREQDLPLSTLQRLKRWIASWFTIQPKE